MRFRGFIGPSYTLSSRNVDCQRSVNLFPVQNEMGTGKGGEPYYLVGTPGTRKLLTVGDGPIRCIHVTQSGIILVVSGNTLYKVEHDPLTDTWSSSAFATPININTPIVKASSASGNQHFDGDGNPFTEEMVVFVAGDEEFLYWRWLNLDGQPQESFGPFSAFGYGGAFRIEPFENAYGPTHVELIDGYRIYNKLNTGRFYVSDLESPHVDPLSFFAAEGDPDNLLAVLANYRDLWLFGERTTEVWQSSGDSNAPFIRAAGGFLEVGLFARYSAVSVAGAPMWLGRNKEGRGIVYRAQGFQPVRVSTHAIEFAINSYANPENAVAYAYQEEGHFFYVLNFDEGTWVYDVTTGLWHERARLVNGELKRHHANVYAFAPHIKGGIHLIGDHETGDLYQMSMNFYSDDDEEIVHIRTFPHLTAGLKRVRHKSLQVDMETGVGLDGEGLGTDPKAILDWSDDGGHSFGNEHWASIGKIGQRRMRLKWNRLGMSRDRVYRLRITDRVKITLIGAEIDAEAGGS